MNRLAFVFIIFITSAVMTQAQTVGLTHLRASIDYVSVNDDILEQIDDSGIGYNAGLSYNLLPFMDLIADIGTTELSGGGTDIDVDSISAGFRLIAAQDDRLAIFADIELLHVENDVEVELDPVGLPGSVQTTNDDTGFSAALGVEMLFRKTSVTPSIEYHDLFEGSSVTAVIGVHAWCYDQIGFGLKAGFDTDDDEYTLTFNMTFGLGE